MLGGRDLDHEISSWRRLLTRQFTSKHPDDFWPVGLLEGRRYAGLLARFTFDSVSNADKLSDRVVNPAALLTLLTYLLPGSKAFLSTDERKMLIGSILSVIARSRKGDLWNTSGRNDTAILDSFPRFSVGLNADASIRFRALLFAVGEAYGFVNHRLFTESAGPVRDSDGHQYVRRAAFKGNLAWVWSHLGEDLTYDLGGLCIDTRFPASSVGPWFDEYANPLWVADRTSQSVHATVQSAAAVDHIASGEAEAELHKAIIVITGYIAQADRDELCRQLMRIMASAIMDLVPNLTDADLDAFCLSVPKGLAVERASGSVESHILNFFPNPE